MPPTIPQSKLLSFSESTVSPSNNVEGASRASGEASSGLMVLGSSPDTVPSNDTTVTPFVGVDGTGGSLRVEI